MQQIKDGSSTDLQFLVDRLRSLAQQHKGDPQKLLGILRELEALHTEICHDLFLPALPNTRRDLFNLLMDIETNGGWPYIYRLSLDAMCQNLANKLATESTQSGNGNRDLPTDEQEQSDGDR